MALLTCGEVFCGGGGWIASLLDALTPVWAIDNDPTVVEAYRRNFGNHVICADATTVDVRSLPQVDILFASPPCQQWSLARSQQAPERIDAEIGTIVCHYIEVLQPRFVFVENVRGYARSRALQHIKNTLSNLGYWFDCAVVNAADYGVPQVRERLILRASLLSAVPNLPSPQTQVGWYAAIEDLLPSLPSSQLTGGQRCLRRFAQRPSQLHSHELDETLLIERIGARSGYYQKRRPEQPAWTIRCAITTDQRGCDRSRFIDAICNSQVLRLNTRALARLQSFPDHYVLPERTSVAGRIIGNAVPPLMARTLVLNTIF